MLIANNIFMSETPGASFQDIGFYFKTSMSANRIIVDHQYMYFVRRDDENSSVFARDKINYPLHEYKAVRRYLSDKPDLRRSYIRYYTYRKFKSYRFTLERISDEYCKTFMRGFIREWRYAMEHGEVDYSLFTDAELDWIREHLKGQPRKKTRPKEIEHER